MSQKRSVFIILHPYDRPVPAAGALQPTANLKAFDTKVRMLLDRQAMAF